MKYLKKFERRNKYNIEQYDLKVGEYVLLECHTNPFWPTFANNAITYMSKHAGRISKISRYSNAFMLEYEDVPEDIQTYFGTTTKENVFNRDISIDVIKYVGKTKYEVELKAETDKYNL